MHAMHKNMLEEFQKWKNTTLKLGIDAGWKSLGFEMFGFKIHIIFFIERACMVLKVFCINYCAHTLSRANLPEIKSCLIQEGILTYFFSSLC